mmetsp:Transcript_99091/g.285918  ORF Transcript_99091/g.285918 Transcript_99091/m.285918 type:complete len:82 (+) Transcript_99091:908-1153(+)
MLFQDLKGCHLASTGCFRMELQECFPQLENDSSLLGFTSCCYSINDQVADFTVRFRRQTMQTINQLLPGRLQLFFLIFAIV